MLKSHQISLRLLEDNDLEFLYSIENNPDNKKYGSSYGYLSKKTLKVFFGNFVDKYPHVNVPKILNKPIIDKRVAAHQPGKPLSFK